MATYLSRTSSSSPTATTTWTYSAWIKRSLLNTSDAQKFFAAGSSSSDRTEFYLATDGTFNIYKDVSGSAANLASTRTFRDVNAWYHFVVQNNNGTITVYVNNETVSLSSSSLGTNKINAASTTHYVGRQVAGGQNFFGMISHFHFIDGTIYAPSAFGETDSTTGMWKIKATPSVSYGDDGWFILKDGNNLSGSTVQDQSGKGNNFTASGNLTSLKDCPDNVFAVWNALDWGSNYSTLTNCNSTAQSNASAYPPVVSTLGVSKGKYYWEVKYSAKDGGSDYPIIGITSTQATAVNHELGEFANDWGYYTSNGTPYYRNSASSTSYGTAYTVGDIICVALDLDNNKLYFRKNDSAWENSGNPTSGSTGTGAINITDPASTPLGEYFAAASYFDGSQKGTFDANFGNGYFGTTAVSSAQNPDDGTGIFEYDVPAGYRALCTKSINAQEYS